MAKAKQDSQPKQGLSNKRYFGEDVGIDVPIEGDGSETAIHIDVHLNAVQKRGLGLLFAGLRKRHARTREGRYVQAKRHAVQWLLEKIEEAAGGKGTEEAAYRTEEPEGGRRAEDGD